MQVCARFLPKVFNRAGRNGMARQDLILNCNRPLFVLAFPIFTPASDPALVKERMN